jgi:Flp pilus assembly protein TadD
MDLVDAFTAALADHQAGRLAEAERGYRAILGEATHLASLHNLAVILDASGRSVEAGQVYRQAADAAPDNPKPQAALATHLRETRQFTAAEAAYRRTLELAPDYPNAALDLGMVLLATGRFAEGWPLYERRRARMQVLERGLAIPEWRGEPLAGKRLFIWREQGYGDQIMMARFLSRLGAAGVCYAGPPALQRLFARLPAEFIAVGAEGIKVSSYDYWTLPLSLPHWLGVTSETAASPPYLCGEAGKAGGRIGVVLRGEAQNRNDRFRSLPPELGAELLSLPGAISLDPADSGAADFQATADIIAGLDLVITVDTAVAHLAGAMGRPVWVLLARHALDWQWPREGASPWYPSARLFIQPEPGDWASLVATVKAEALRLS